MTSWRVSKLDTLVAVIAAVVAMVFVVVRRQFDLGLVWALSVNAFLVGALIWRLKHRSPYGRSKNDLNLK